MGRGNLATLPSDPLPSQWSPNFPLRAWDPFPSPRRPSAVPVPPHLHFSSPFTPSTHHVLPSQWGGVPSIPLGVRGPPPVPGRCPSCEETRILCPPSLPSWLHPMEMTFDTIASSPNLVDLYGEDKCLSFQDVTITH